VPALFFYRREHRERREKNSPLSYTESRRFFNHEGHEGHGAKPSRQLTADSWQQKRINRRPTQTHADYLTSASLALKRSLR